jgi:UDP-3-O-[3-hydroxymyristoyl] glucosamine N-acyltransferase
VTPSGIPLSRLASLVEGHHEGDEVTITGVNTIDAAREGDIVFVDGPELLPVGEASLAAALIVPPLAKTNAKPIIITEDPRLAFSKVLALFAPQRHVYPGVHPTAVLGTGVRLGARVSVGAHAYVGGNTTLEADAVVHPLAYVGQDAIIGENSEIHPQAYIGDRVVVGRNCIVYPGAVIGSDGFGYHQEAGRHRKIPQIGTVILEDEVAIGANSTVDRATIAATVIGAGTKLDDSVHIAHNCVIGRNCLFAGQVGIAGSTHIGDYVVMGGQSGVNDHVRVCGQVMVGARAGVFSNIEEPGTYSGYPAKPHRGQLRVLAATQKLPELLKRLKELEDRIAELEGRG